MLLGVHVVSNRKPEACTKDTAIMKKKRLKKKPTKAIGDPFTDKWVGQVTYVSSLWNKTAKINKNSFKGDRPNG